MKKHEKIKEHIRAMKKNAEDTVGKLDETNPKGKEGVKMMNAMIVAYDGILSYIRSEI